MLHPDSAYRRSEGNGERIGIRLLGTPRNGRSKAEPSFRYKYTGTVKKVAQVSRPLLSVTPFVM